MNILYTDDTICAIATAQGGAIGTIRVSGKEAISITDKIFTQAGGAPLSERKPYTLKFGHIMSENGEIVDEVLVSLFRGPHSYTGEDSTEISCHGSSYILQQVMQLLVKNGCRAAGPGEFTQRAFLNGKMDLSQAEAVADLIASTSAATHRMAMSQMRGGFSRELSALREKLLHLTSLMELELDFSDHEELEFADRSELSEIASQVETVINGLVHSFSVGNAIKNGIPVAIIGETNAGKSTLLNALLNEERAIVSDIHGTTRDVIEDTMNIDGVMFRFIDTAGIRRTEDAVEKIGVDRAREYAEKADLIIYVADASRELDENDEQILDMIRNKKTVILLNKSDLDPVITAEMIKEKAGDIPIISASAKEEQGIQELEETVEKMFLTGTISFNDQIYITNVRQKNALVSASESMKKVVESIGAGMPEDFFSIDLMDAYETLGSITGESAGEDLVNEIFSKFCMGK